LKKRLKIHLLAIGGTGMGALAQLLKSQGHIVSGCDKKLYSPMKEAIGSLNIDFYEGFDPSHLEINPDVVVIGNAISKENDEAKRFIEKGFKYYSMAEAIYQFALKDKKPIVVTGTHGKTTTTALISYLIKESGQKVNMILGGISKDYNSSSIWEDGEFTVVEGDEYETAFFDKEPKFYHYDPHFLIINNIEMDHLDNFKNEEEIYNAFKKLVNLLRKDGMIFGGTESPLVAKLLYAQQRNYESFGITGGQCWTTSNILYAKEGTYFTLLYKGREVGKFLSPLYGPHNLRNSVVALALSAQIGISFHLLREILPEFKGVKRRQEVVKEDNGIIVIDDFGHHPTAIFETIKSLRFRFNPDRVIVCWEPRSYTSQTKLNESKMPNAFLYANTVLMGPRPKNPKIPEEMRLSLENISQALNSLGKETFICETEEKYFKTINSIKRKGDLIIFFSSGNFFDLPRKVAETE
jgi:UDP-N-acetylmuramate: L-alanyl-gamma-D-glutamyl-meso-diaminopimelate ligase